MIEDVPGYRVLDQVGEGGFSVVYRARQEGLDRTVALKVLSLNSVDATAMRRFQRECKITAKLSDHPNIVTVLDNGTTRSGRPYIAMEYFEHGAIADRLDREGQLPVADVLRIGVKMAG
ncbi:protein kinase, partial [Actinomadura adrarensis]